MPASIHFLALLPGPLQGDTTSISPFAYPPLQPEDTAVLTDSLARFRAALQQRAQTAAPDDWLLLWPDAAITPRHKGFRVWRQQLAEAPATALLSSACGRLTAQSVCRHWVTPRPYPALPWLYQQNPLGGVLAVRAGWLKRLSTDAWARETTAAGLIHALLLTALTEGGLQPEQVLRSHEVAYRLPLAMERQFVFPRLQQSARVAHYSALAGASLAWAADAAGDAETLQASLPATPLVSILIPFRNRPELLRMCLEAILAREAAYPHFEVIGINNQSGCSETLALMADYAARDPRIRFIDHDAPFNFSALNNHGAQVARGEHLVMMNNDIELITPDWLPQLLAWSLRPEVGAVGAKLYYPDETVQHVGCTLGLHHGVGHSFKHSPRHQADPWGWTTLTRNVTCVTGALVMVKTALYHAVGGLDEKQFAIAYNDIDFCLKLHQRGAQNLLVAGCEAYHHESVSRKKGKALCADRQAQEKREWTAFASRYADLIRHGDPYFSPYLDHFDERTQPTRLVFPFYDRERTKKIFWTKIPFSNKKLHLYQYNTAQMQVKLRCHIR